MVVVLVCVSAVVWWWRPCIVYSVVEVEALEAVLAAVERERRGAAAVGAAAASPGPNHPRYGGKLEVTYRVM